MGKVLLQVSYTGATYRCVALKALRNNLKVEDKDEIIKLSNNIDIKFDLNNNVYLDGENVTKEIRSKEVTSIVSPISSIVEVRKNMVDLQRRLGNSNNVVMEGRDITTVVFPNADYKFYLDATLEERVNRRYKEYQEKNVDMSYDEIYENIKSRDYNDSHKEVGSLTRTDDQIYIDSTNLTIDEVVEKFIEVIK